MRNNKYFCFKNLNSICRIYLKRCDALQVLPYYQHDKNDAKKILDNLIEGSKNFIEDIKYIEENKEKKNKFVILAENNFKSCDMCLIF